MALRDKLLVCCECGRSFIFTKRAQWFYAKNDFKHQPKRCKPCRIYRKSNVEIKQPAFTSWGIEMSLPSADRDKTTRGDLAI